MTDFPVAPRLPDTVLARQGQLPAKPAPVTLTGQHVRLEPLDAPFRAQAFDPACRLAQRRFCQEGTEHCRVGGGVDIHLARWFSVGVTGGYNWTVNFSEPLGFYRNFNGPSVALGIGWLWGKGY